MTVETAATKGEALRKVADHSYDLILLDIMLPGGSGLEVLRALKESGKQGNVIIISAKDSLDDKLAGLDLGADDYLLARLDANPATLRERIIAREPDGWFGLEYLLDEMQRLHATMPSLEGVHVVLDTERLTVRQITESIRAARADVLGVTT